MSDAYDLDAGPDPAARAAARPEPAAASPESETESHRSVPAVGIGPGNVEYLTPRGERAIREADVVVGFESVVSYVSDLVEGEALTCGYRSEAETLERFAERVVGGERGTAVLMGDPNHSGYQFLGKVEAALESAAADGDDAPPVEIVPGISSLQIAASRARTPMEATTFVTLHRSGPIDDSLAWLRQDVGDRHLLVLPRPYDWMPERIAATLLEAGADPELSALVFEHLTHESESVTSTTLGALAAEDAPERGDDAQWGRDETSFSDLSVLAIRRD